MSLETPFWTSQPSELLNKKHILEMWPVECMSINAKLNAITRLVIVMTAIGYFTTNGASHMLAVGFITILGLVALHYFKVGSSSSSSKESFVAVSSPLIPMNPTERAAELYAANRDLFTSPTSKNPLQNVLIHEIGDNPLRKPAPPSYNEDVTEQINESVKTAIQEMNPGVENIRDKLFSNLGDDLVFEQSMRNFTSNPSTQIPNDQSGFAKFCYGTMTSCKNGILTDC